MPVAHLDPCGSAIVLPVGHTVTDGETLQVRQEHTFISISNVVLVDVVGQVGHIDASVGLTRDVKVVGAKLGELVEESEDSLKILLT